MSERTQRPVEFQMRPHWFVRVLDLSDELLARSAELGWHPEYMKVRLDRWIEGLKYDWNITRQRFYGVPFPVWFCEECGEPVLATEEQLPVDPLESRAAGRRVREVRRHRVHGRSRRHGHVDDVVDDAADQRELGPLARPATGRAAADDAARAGVRDHPDLALLLARRRRTCTTTRSRGSTS